MGRSERLALRRYIATVLEYLIKLPVLPATEPRNGWTGLVGNGRRNIGWCLKSGCFRHRHGGDKRRRGCS